MEREDNTVTVTDTLPAGLTYNSSSGTGWSCSAAGQVVTCTHAPTINPGASLPPLSLVVNIAEAAAASVTNSVTVSSPSYELVTRQQHGDRRHRDARSEPVDVHQVRRRHERR